MTLLAGRYTLDVPLGDSDLGTVWNAHDEDGSPLVVLTLEEDAAPALHERFRAHAKVLLTVKHPSLVRAIAHGDAENGAPFLVTERLNGTSLATRLERGPAPTVARVIDIGVALAEALTLVHAAGIAHGDVEPANVLLVDVDGKEVPKLIGFALNRASVRQELGARMSLPSITPLAYAAPEQARGDALGSPLADQASLAALVYAALAGRPPYIARDVEALATAIGTQRAPTISTVRRDLAPLGSTLDRALASDPKKRFADMAGFGRALKTAGTMAKAIAATEVPLGSRSPIGTPPPPVAPRLAAIPKPGAAMTARAMPAPAMPAPAMPVPAKTPTLKSVPKPSMPTAPASIVVAAEPEPEGRSTQEIDVRDLEITLAAPPSVPFAPAPTEAEPPPPPPPRRREPTASFEIADLKSEPPSAPTPSPPPAPPVRVAPPPPSPVADETHGRTSGARLVASHTTDADAVARPAPPVPKIAPPLESADSQVKTDTRPAVPPVDEPSVSVSPSMETIVTAATAKAVVAAAPAREPANAAPLEDDPDLPSLESMGGRKPWVVPTAIAAIVLLVIVSWVGLRSLRAAPPGRSGTTLTTSPPPTSAIPPTVAVQQPPPPTTTVAIAPPPTTPPTAVAVPEPPRVPPTTVAIAPPPTHVAIAPPPTHAPPPPSRTPPATTARPPHTPPATTARTPRTPHTPPPSTTVSRPPPTTGHRPTVVSDPGF